MRARVVAELPGRKISVTCHGFGNSVLAISRSRALSVSRLRGCDRNQPTAATGQELRQKPGEQGMGTLSQGFLESANVKAVEEMIDMITTQRSYEMNSKVITTADQMLQKLTNLR